MSATLRVTNITRNSILATHAAIALDPESRRMGLIGYTLDEFQPGSGLFFPECNAIHTVEMTFPIDVIFIDMLKLRVVKVVEEAIPTCHFNTLVPKEICAVLELPPGVVQATGTKPGDVISILSSGHASNRERRWLGSNV